MDELKKIIENRDSMIDPHTGDLKGIDISNFDEDQIIEALIGDVKKNE